MTTRQKVMLVITLLLLAAGAILLGACAKNQPDIPSRDPLPCSTFWSPLDQNWYDSDGEIVDGDPCDGVDVKTSKTPAVKPHQTSAPKKSTAPAPRVTRR